MTSAATLARPLASRFFNARRDRLWGRMMTDTEAGVRHDGFGGAPWLWIRNAISIGRLLGPCQLLLGAFESLSFFAKQGRTSEPEPARHSAEMASSMARDHVAGTGSNNLCHEMRKTCENRAEECLTWNQHGIQFGFPAGSGDGAIRRQGLPCRARCR